jgi:hypothetical protein
MQSKAGSIVPLLYPWIALKIKGIYNIPLKEGGR